MSVAAAVDGQRILAAESWKTTGPLRARMALHTGEAEKRAGDYFGQPVNWFARILSAGHGGQILLSTTIPRLGARRRNVQERPRRRTWGQPLVRLAPPLRPCHPHRIGQCVGTVAHRPSRQREYRDVRENQQIDVNLRLWSDDDLPLLERLMGDPAMTAHIGGPETPAKIRDRHERYLRLELGKDRMFVIVVGSQRIAAGSIGYWEREWRGQQVWETGWSVLPEFQGRGIATRAIIAMFERARADGTHRFICAYPSVANGPSNAICRKAGFTLLGEHEYEYPPGNVLRCNDWRLDLLVEASEV